MSQPIPPEIQAQIAAGVGWLWSQYGQKAVEKVAGRGVALVRDEIDKTVKMKRYRAISEIDRL